MRQPNFARLNHVLIPATKEGRDRLRAGAVGRLGAPVAAAYTALTDEGRMVGLLAIIVGGFGIDVRSTELYVLWSMLTAMLLASLVARRFYAMKDVRAEVVVPRRVLLGEELVFGVILENRGTRDHHGVRVSGPFLPWDGRWSDTWPGVARLRVGESARVELRARFVARGEHHLDSFHAAALVPLGLAQGRAVKTTGARFLVLPRIASVARLTLPESRRQQPGGIALVSRTGESMELMGVRPYRPGDPIRYLHARSWARTGRPIVREFEEEFFRRVAVLVDVDPADDGCAEAAISLAAGVVAHLSRGEAVIDLLVAGERIHDLTLGRNLGFLEQALELLACFEPSRTSATDPSALLSRLSPHLGRLSCVIVIDAGGCGAAMADHVRAHGVGCAWLRVERKASAKAAALREGARVVDVDAIERGEDLAL
jgi:uncharacterized protein (DUF58 family)